MTDTKKTIVTTAIPYVNAAPHLGFALEAVVTDAIARSARLQGHDVHHQSGTDDNSLKNVRAAEARGLSTEELVDDNAARFQELPNLLDLSWDAFVRTSRHPNHADTVREVWRLCRDRGDIYQGVYEGLYCVGCERYYDQTELLDGCCPEHGGVPERVLEHNYFFRLSRYTHQLTELVRSGALRIEPEERRKEVLQLLESGLRDFSVSRSTGRARGWGLLVPDDPTQVIYVWFDALLNYVSGLGPDGFDCWRDAARIEHVIGKGILRFHAIYWPAILLSAGLSLPTDVLVHGYLTVEGRKIGKSLGNAIDPTTVVEQFGIDAVRYCLLRHVSTTRDGDFSRERLVTAHDSELADQLGNLVHRTASLLDRYCGGQVPTSTTPGPLETSLLELVRTTSTEVANAVEQFALHEALASVWQLIAAGNRYVDQTEPWRLARAEGSRDRLDIVLGTLAVLVHSVALLLRPFLPATASEVLRRFGGVEDGPLQPGTKIESGPPLFPKQRPKERVIGRPDAPIPNPFS
jgi:methionyl-tRNA synthetase